MLFDFMLAINFSLDFCLFVWRPFQIQHVFFSLLDYELENFVLGVKYGPCPVFANKVLSEHNISAHLFVYCQLLVLCLNRIWVGLGCSCPIQSLNSQPMNSGLFYKVFPYPSILSFLLATPTEGLLL